MFQKDIKAAASNAARLSAVSCCQAGLYLRLIRLLKHIQRSSMGVRLVCKKRDNTLDIVVQTAYSYVYIVNWSILGLYYYKTLLRRSMLHRHAFSFNWHVFPPLVLPPMYPVLKWILQTSHYSAAFGFLFFFNVVAIIHKEWVILLFLNTWRLFHTKLWLFSIC